MICWNLESVAEGQGELTDCRSFNWVSTCETNVSSVDSIAADSSCSARAVLRILVVSMVYYTGYGWNT